MSETSQAAHQVAQRGAKQVAYRIYLQIKDAGQEGVTRDDLVQCFQVLGIDYSTVTARIRALVFSGLVIDGPDKRPTRKNNPAKVLRTVPGLDFKLLYGEPGPRAGRRCSEEEREFLDRCHSLDMAMRGSTMKELDTLDAPKLLWEYFCELRKTPGIIHTGSSFRDQLGNCAWCHDAKCINGCVS